MYHYFSIVLLFHLFSGYYVSVDKYSNSGQPCVKVIFWWSISSIIIPLKSVCLKDRHISQFNPLVQHLMFLSNGNLLHHFPIVSNLISIISLCFPSFCPSFPYKNRGESPIFRTWKTFLRLPWPSTVTVAFLGDASNGYPSINLGIPNRMGKINHEWSGQSLMIHSPQK